MYEPLVCVYQASRVCNLHALPSSSHFPVSMRCFCFSKPTKISLRRVTEGLLEVRLDAPTPDILRAEFSAVLCIDPPFLTLALLLVSGVSFSNNSLTLSLQTFSWFSFLGPLPQSSPGILAFLQNRAWASHMPHKLRLNFTSATCHLPGPIHYHLLPKLLQ